MRQIQEENYILPRSRDDIDIIKGIYKLPGSNESKKLKIKVFTIIQYNNPILIISIGDEALKNEMIQMKEKVRSNQKIFVQSMNNLGKLSNKLKKSLASGNDSEIIYISNMLKVNCSNFYDQHKLFLQ